MHVPDVGARNAIREERIITGVARHADMEKA
jgi:hypothetical protein